LLHSLDSSHKGKHTIFGINCLEEICQALVTPNNRYIVTAGRDHSIKIWALDTREELHTFKDAHFGKI